VTQPHWLVAWFFEQALALRKDEEDPGVPAYPYTATGARVVLPLSDGGTAPMPVSFVAAARQKIPSVLNMDKLRRDLLERLGLKGY
jgi:hypothetical protein